MDERFRLFDMAGRVADATAQTEDGFDEVLLKEIEREVVAGAPEVVGLEPGEELDDADADADADADDVSEDIAAANAFDAAADSAFAYAAAAFTDIRHDDDNDDGDDDDDDDDDGDDDDDDDDDDCNNVVPTLSYT
jgi:hypothetical protein